MKRKPLIIVSSDEKLQDIAEERELEKEVIEQKRRFVNKQIEDFNTYVTNSKENIENKNLDRLKELKLIEDFQVDISVEDGVVYQYEERDVHPLSSILSGLFGPFH